jgi:cytochrome c-type biogenesis protein CcmF
MISREENFFTAIWKLISRNHRRYGGYIIHLAVVMIALGVIGDAYFKQETQSTVALGESITIDDYTLRFDDLQAYPGSDGREIIEASTTLLKNGEVVRELNPRRDYFVVQRQPVTVPAVYSTPGVDVYVLLVGWEEIGFSASTFKIFINPLINWVWIGGMIMILGTLIAAWPSHKEGREKSYVLKRGRLSHKAISGD